MLDEILSKANLNQAWKKVRANGGVAGVDSVTIEEFQEYAQEHWARIKQEIIEESYQPSPVKRVEIPKANGHGKRKLGIPTVLDRVLCHVLHQTMAQTPNPDS